MEQIIDIFCHETNTVSNINSERNPYLGAIKSRSSESFIKGETIKYDIVVDDYYHEIIPPKIYGQIVSFEDKVLERYFYLEDGHLNFYKVVAHTEEDVFHLVSRQSIIDFYKNQKINTVLIPKNSFGFNEDTFDLLAEVSSEMFSLDRIYSKKLALELSMKMDNYTNESYPFNVSSYEMMKEISENSWNNFFYVDKNTINLLGKKIPLKSFIQDKKSSSVIGLDNKTIRYYFDNKKPFMNNVFSNDIYNRLNATPITHFQIEVNLKRNKPDVECVRSYNYLSHIGKTKSLTLLELEEFYQFISFSCEDSRITLTGEYEKCIIIKNLTEIYFIYLMNDEISSVSHMDLALAPLLS